MKEAEKLDQEQEEENEDTSNPESGSGSDDASEDDIFDDDDSQSDDDKSEDEEEAKPEDEVKSLREKVDSLEKGFKKAFSKKGVEDKSEEQKKDKQAASPQYDDEVIEEVTLTKYPDFANAEKSLEQAKEIAGKTGRSLLKVLREEGWLVEKAKAEAEAKKVEEERKSKINKPSSGTPPPKKDVSSTKPEDVEKLPPKEKVEWIKLQAKKERETELEVAD